MKDINSYEEILGRLNSALILSKEYANLMVRYTDSDDIDDELASHILKVKLSKIKGLIGETIEPIDFYNTADIPDDTMLSDDAMPYNIIDSIVYDIRFITKGLNYLRSNNHASQANLLDLEDIETSKKGFKRQEYSNATIYVFKSNQFGVAKEPGFVFNGLDECIEYFSKNIEGAKNSKDVKGSIWKALKDAKKGRSMFGYRFSLVDDLNKLI
jgi:hypothetical protein